MTSSVNFVDSFPEGEAMKEAKIKPSPWGEAEDKAKIKPSPKGKPRIRNARKKEC